MTPLFIQKVNETPQGRPVVLQLAPTPALAYHHRRNLGNSGVVAEVVAPSKTRRVGGGLVTNPTDHYALVAIGGGLRGTDDVVVSLHEGYKPGQRSKNAVT
jgi:hypothetical protein